MAPYSSTGADSGRLAAAACAILDTWVGCPRLRRVGCVNEIESFGAVVLAVAAVGLAAVLSSRLSERLRVPAPALFLLGAAAASDLWPALGHISVGTVEQVVTVA